MGNSRKTNNKKPQQTNKAIIAVGCVIAVIILGYIFIKAGFSTGNTTETASGDITILKSDVSEIAKFYPYKTGKTNLEVLAVKASDGTIRTAFNTCQICYSSGRGYYKQQGGELVCQNCGNRFKLDQVEKIKGGCNPVPIMKENKVEDDTSIVIPGSFLKQAKDLFANWKS